MTKLILPFCFCLVFFAQTVSAHEAHCEDTELGAIMSKMKKEFKSLKKAVGSNDFAQIMIISDNLIDQSLQSKEHEPLLAKHEELDQNAYLSKLDKMIEDLRALKEQAKLENAEEIDRLRKQINKHRKQGHKQFRMDCD